MRLDLSPCSEEEFLWNFAYSEVDSESRHGDAWRAQVGPRLLETLQRGARDELRPADWAVLCEVLCRVRGWYIPQLLATGVRWHRTRFPVKRLGEVRLIRHQPFLAIAPSCRLDEFVHALDAGGETPGDRFAARYRRLRSGFLPERARGLPMLVATQPSGPYTEVDGLTRMSMYLSRFQQGETVPASLELLVGLSEKLPEWPYF